MPFTFTLTGQTLISYLLLGIFKPDMSAFSRLNSKKCPGEWLWELCKAGVLAARLKSWFRLGVEDAYCPFKPCVRFMPFKETHGGIASGTPSFI